MSDPGTARCLKMYIGSLLYAGNKEEKVMFWVGCGGNGKSLIDLALRYALGDFYMVMPVGVYTNYERDHNRPSSIIAELKGKRLAVCSETDETKFVTANFTKASGGDAVTARHLNKEQIHFEPTHKSLIHTNNLPKFTATPQALFRRIMVVWFRYQFKEQHDYDVGNPLHKLRDESLKYSVKTAAFR